VEGGVSVPEAAAAQRVSLFCSRMRSRHLELLKSLSAKNREREEQQKKEEKRLSKRESLLRDRILHRSHSTDARAGYVASSSSAAAAPTAVEDRHASEATGDERRQYQLRVNSECQKRQEEALRRLACHQETERVRQEREKLKKEWRVHRAKKYLLHSCQNAEIREYLESKGKPRALPKLPAPGRGDQLFSGLSIRGLNAESVAEQEDEEPELVVLEEGADELCAVEHSPGSNLEEEVPAHSSSGLANPYERHCSSPARNFLPPNAAQQTQQSINRFLERTRMTRAAAHCGDIAEWKRRNGCEADRQVFICNGGYPDLRDALLRRGWFQNMDKDSKHFDLKWGMAADIDHDRLKPFQVVNHFDKCRDLTTKVGLSLNLRNCVWHTGVEAEEFYPRAYDLSDPAERADFVLNFKFTKAESILRQFVHHVENKAEMTFSEEIVDVASKICLRLLTDVDDILDCPEIAENLASVSASEWSLLKEVCLEDVTRKLEQITKEEDLEEMISRTAIADIQKKRAIQDEKEKKDKEREADLRKGSKNKKKKKKGDDPETEVPRCASTASFASTRGQHLSCQAKSIIQELEHKSMQHATHGTRNAWIVKPAGKSRGRGIQVMRELDEIFKVTESDGYQWISQKYIEQPQLIHGYKFDIRQWVLVADWNPLTLYVWRHPYLRFAGTKYDDSLSSLSEYMHLVNNSIIKNMDGFEEKNSELNASGYMWFREQYEAWLHQTYCKCKRHSTPWLRPPAYTCETFGVRWEDVAFTAKEEEEEDDEDDGGCNSCDADSAAKPQNSEPSCSSTGQVAPDLSIGEGARPSSPTESEDHPHSSDGSEASASLVSAVPCLQACTCGRHLAPAANFCKKCGKSREMVEAEMLKSSEPAANAEEDRVDGDDASDGFDEDHCCENLWDTCIKPQINDIITSSLLSVIDSITHRKNSYELYGYDFMLSEGPDGRPKVWLIEVNSSPACDYSTPVTTPLVKKMMEDTVKVMVDKRADSDCDTGEWELLQHPYSTKVSTNRAYALNMDKLEVLGSQIKPPQKKKCQKKKKQKSKNTKLKVASSGDSEHKAAADDDDGDPDADDEEDDVRS